MLHQALKAALFALAFGAAFFLFQAMDAAFDHPAGRERAEDLVLMPEEQPEESQRLLVLVRETKQDGDMLTVELTLRNNSEYPVAGHVWGHAHLASASGQAAHLIESEERLSFKAKVKTFKTLRFALPQDAKAEVQRFEIFVSDDVTGIVTRFGERHPPLVN